MTDQAFAFGCFHFGLRKRPPAGFTVGAFIKEIERSLRAVPNVDNVQVSCDPQFVDGPLNWSGEPPSLTEGDRPFPTIEDEQITFDLLIPFGLQKELRGLSHVPLTYTERFHVRITYMYRNPVAVFLLMSPSQAPKPSEAVVIIRNLLEREFQRRQDSIVDFQFLGPSPLHADLYLTAEVAEPEATEWDYNLVVTQTRRYDRYYFTYNAAAFSGPEEALDALLWDLLEEVDVYYLATQLAREDILTWGKLQTLARELTDLHRRRGFKGYLARTLKGPHLLDNAFITLTEFEADSLLKRSMLLDDYRSTYSSDTPAYIKELVDERIEENTQYPSEQVSKLLQLFETRRLSAAELRVVVISAISGGVFVALVTILFGGA